MDINRLLSDELTYELRIRGIDLGVGTVSVKRSLLREALRKEQLGLDNYRVNVDFDPIQELVICSNKLDELLGSIQEFNIDNRENEFKRIKTRLLHAQGRVLRIKTNNSDMQSERDNLAELCNELLQTLSGRYAETETVAKVNNNMSLIDQRDPAQVDDEQNHDHRTPRSNCDLPNQELLSLSLARGDLIDVGQVPPISQPSIQIENEARKDGINTATNNNNFDATINRLTDRLKLINFSQRSDTPENVKSRAHVDDFASHRAAANSTLHEISHPSCSHSSKFVDVGRWRLRFDGTSSVTDFLERLEEMRISRSLSKEQLFNSVTELLEGDAAIWYRFARSTVKNYDELRETLRYSFLPTNYEERIWDILKHRTQGTAESVVVYVAHMENLFNKLVNKPSENSRVSFIKGKMLPHVQMAIVGRGITTISSLIHIGREIEEANISAQEYRAPPVNPRGSVEPALEYRHPNRSRVAAISFFFGRGNRMAPTEWFYSAGSVGRNSH